MIASCVKKMSISNCIRFNTFFVLQWVHRSKRNYSRVLFLVLLVYCRSPFSLSCANGARCTISDDDMRNRTVANLTIRLTK